MKSNEPIQVLLLEDSDFDAVLATKAIRKAFGEVRIHHALDGEEAVNLLSAADEAEADIALLDIRVPKISGIEFLEWLRQKEAFVNLPVVIMSSSDDIRDRSAAILHRACRYVQKNMDASEFVANLEAALKACLPGRA